LEHKDSWSLQGAGNTILNKGAP